MFSMIIESVVVLSVQTITDNDGHRKIGSKAFVIENIAEDLRVNKRDKTQFASPSYCMNMKE